MKSIKHIFWIVFFLVAGLRADSRAPVLLYSMDELTRSNYRVISDLLDHIPGVWSRDLGSVGQWSSIRMSGASARETQICLNGMPIHDPWTAETDLNWIPVDLIDRIEVYPTGNPFGLSAPGGVINLVIEDGTVPRPESVFNYRTGSLGFSNLDIDFHQSITPDVSYGFGALVEKYAKTFPARTYDKNSLRGNFSIHLLDRIDLKYRILLNKLETCIPDLFYFPAGQLALTSPFRKTDRQDHFFHIQGDFLKIQNSIQLHISDNRFEYRQRNHTNKATYPVLGTQLHLHQDYAGMGIPVQVGLWRQSQSLSMPDSGKSTLSNTRFYAQTEIPIHGLFSLEGSAAYTRAERVPSFWNGDAHLLWVNGEKGSIRIGGALETRIPNLGELLSIPILHGPEETLLEYELLRQATSRYINPQLKPERSRILDAAIQYKKDAWLDLYSRMFYRQTSDLIRFNGDIVTPLLINTGQYEFYGIETSGGLGPFCGFTLQMTLNYIHSQDEDGKVLLERPNLYGSGSLSWSRSFFEKDLGVHFRLGTRYRSEFWCLAGDALSLAGLAGYVLEFKAVLTFSQAADLFFSMDNLLDTSLFRVYGYPIANRSYRYGIKWNVFD